MLRSLVAFALCGVLVGCCTVVPGVPVPVREEIRLFHHEVAARSDAIEAEILDHIAPGIPAENAKAVLQANDFACRKDDFTALFSHCLPDELAQTGALTTTDRKRGLHGVYCTTRKDVLGPWGREYATVLVLLHVDKADVVQTIDVVSARKRHPFAEFFDKHPDLQEPGGLSLEQAVATMQSHGFRCAPVDRDGHPYTLCEAYSEWALGGKVVRVQLRTDEAGVVRDSEILRQGECFDAERCMLPSGEDSRNQALCKAALFPLREATRITAFTTLYTVGFTLMCFALPH